MVTAFLPFIYFVIALALLLSYFWCDKTYSVSLARSVWYALVFGFIFNLLSMSWMYSTYPLPWFPGGAFQLSLIAFVHVLSSIVAAIPFFLVGLTLWFTRNTYKVSIIAIPLSFVVTELLRSLLLSLLFIGKESAVGLHYTIGNIGQALAVTPLVELAYFGGVFMLTGIFVYIVWILFMHTHVRDTLLYLLFPLLLLAYVHYVVPISRPASKLSVLVVSSSFTDNASSTNTLSEWKYRRDTLHKEILSFATSPPDIIALPEDARYMSLLDDKQLTSYEKAFPHSVLVDGDTLAFGNGFRNYSLIYDTENNVEMGRGKNFLFPFSEYMPYVFLHIFSFVLSSEEVFSFTRNHTYSRGQKVMTYENPSFKVGTLICSELFSYETISKLREQKPTIVIIQSYLSIFHESPLMYVHALTLAQIAGAQLRTQVLASLNDGPGVVVSERGSILRYLSANENTARGEIIIVDSKQ